MRIWYVWFRRNITTCTGTLQLHTYATDQTWLQNTGRTFEIRAGLSSIVSTQLSLNMHARAHTHTHTHTAQTEDNNLADLMQDLAAASSNTIPAQASLNIN